MTVERVADPGATADSRACLYVHGSMPENWNRFTNHDAHWQNAVALSWATAGAEAKRIGLSKDERAWTFSIAGKKLVFDREKGQAVLQP
jgi:hypothetical protein